MKKKILFLVLIIILIVSVYGFFINPTGFAIDEKKINIDATANTFDGFKIIHFSDLLLKSSKNVDDLKNVVKSINELKPDIIVFTGDLISDKSTLSDNDLKKVSEYFNSMECTLYKYAVIGDNDKKDLDKYKEIMKAGDFIVLDNESTYLFYKDLVPIKLTGVTNIEEFENALIMDDDLPTSYNIVFTHYPDYIDTISTKNINLVLAGHSLLGQVRLPFFGGLIRKEQASIYTDSYYEINNTKMYVSNGLGNENLNFRLFNKPTINLYRLAVEK